MLDYKFYLCFHFDIFFSNCILSTFSSLIVNRSCKKAFYVTLHNVTINPEQFKSLITPWSPKPPAIIALISVHMLKYIYDFFSCLFYIFFCFNQSLYFFFFWKRLNWFWMASAAFSVSGASRSMSTSSSCSWGFAADAFSAVEEEKKKKERKNEK